MPEIPQGTWVEIHREILQAGERAPQVPEDTATVALEMRVRGFLTQPAAPGGDAKIVTVTGRHLRGILSEVNPAYSHSFGAPIAALTNIAVEVRSLLRTRGTGR